MTLLLVGCSTNFEKEELVSEISNTVQFGETKNVFVSLSRSFAQQLQDFDLEFGDFSTTSNFLDFVNIRSPHDNARIEILKDGAPFLTIFELQLSVNASYDEVIAQVESSLGGADLQQAVFGQDSFYFIQNNLAINILSFEKSVLAFQFEPKNFGEIRSFIFSLLILN